ncbi:biotin/lipoyl-binding protein, partial [bacterium]|nr:biotin/lipoyl-binding protein [bacterium]
MIENYTNYETKKKNFLKRFFSKYRYFILGALAFFLLYFFWTKFGYILKGQGIIEGKAVTITQRQVVNNLEISAEIKPHITKTYTAFAFSTVENLPVKAGQYVKKGDLLIQLSSDDLNRALKTAESAYRSAKDKLNALQVEYESTKLLYLKNLESQNKVLRTKQQYEKYLNEDFPKVKQSYDDAINNEEELSIKATISGFVTEVNKFKGDLVPKK